MKGLYTRGKSLNNRYGSNFSYNYKDNHRYQARSFISSQPTKEIESQLIKYLHQNQSLAEHSNLLKHLIPLKMKDLLKTWLHENERKSNFIRIYPAKGTDKYDEFF
jgi:hypothetical protein